MVNGTILSNLKDPDRLICGRLLKESPMLFANVLQHVATLLPVQGISITLNEKKPDITISKEESIVSMKR